MSTLRFYQTNRHYFHGFVGGRNKPAPAGTRGHSLVICHSSKATKATKATDSLACRVHVRSVTAHSWCLPAFLSLPRKERSIFKRLLNLFSYLLVLFSYHLIPCPHFLFNQWIFLEFCFTKRKRKEISLSAIQSIQTNKAYPPTPLLTPH